MRKQSDNQRRAYWLKTLHQWHWVSSALCLIAIVLFSVTGFTLNHASDIEAKPAVTRRDAQLPANLRAQLGGHADKDRAPLPADVQAWLKQTIGVRSGDQAAEWSDDEAYVALPRPGGDAWLSIDLADGKVQYESTDRGWISYFNDLHKGRNTGPLWRWFIDLFAIACLVFSVTGLFLLQLHARQRAATWPLVAFGLAFPLLIALLFIH
jgi:hypothetical protein